MFAPSIIPEIDDFVEFFTTFTTILLYDFCIKLYYPILTDLIVDEAEIFFFIVLDPMVTSSTIGAELLTARVTDAFLVELPI